MMRQQELSGAVVGATDVGRILCAPLIHAEIRALKVRAEELCARVWLARIHAAQKARLAVRLGSASVAIVASSAVTPWAALAAVIVAKASTVGSLKVRPYAPCVWMSISPGAIQRPPTSTISVIALSAGSDDAEDLATLDDDGLAAGNPIGQNERATRERDTAMWLRDAHTLLRLVAWRTSCWLVSIL
jgi:hypothetical protein